MVGHALLGEEPETDIEGPAENREVFPEDSRIEQGLFLFLWDNNTINNNNKNKNSVLEWVRR